MRIPIFALLLVSLAVPVLAQASKSYDSAPYGFRLQYPGDWEVAESRSSAFVRFYTPADADPSGPLKESIDVEVGTVSDNMSMDMFSYSQKYQVEQQYPGMALKQSKPSRLGRLDAHRFEFQGSHQGRAMTLIMVFAISGKQSYCLTYLAESAEYKRHTSLFDNVARSFVAR
ncbi:MAG: PsbP-related protein [Candidatus Eremiobacterota bacterium]